MLATIYKPKAGRKNGRDNKQKRGKGCPAAVKETIAFYLFKLLRTAVVARRERATCASLMCSDRARSHCVSLSNFTYYWYVFIANICANMIFREADLGVCDPKGMPAV